MTTIDLMNPQPKDVHIEDIAHSLSLICRFGGHTKCFYSVAQHSVLVAQMIDPEYKLIGLLHDASEAYIGDIVSPLKALLNQYIDVEDRFNLAIGQRFGMSDALLNMPPEVKHADMRALRTEVRDVVGGELRPWECWGDGDIEPYDDVITPLSSDDARELFLKEFATIRIPSYEEIAQLGHA